MQLGRLGLVLRERIGGDDVGQLLWVDTSVYPRDSSTRRRSAMASCRWPARLTPRSRTAYVAMRPA
ncbi:MAG: hypothetical protein AUI14_23380 [Actinobacteria bacterium 13_2_20CM_2_71_6]|nr:MAG: hypothetical protein AUI14_23380 [Actinobacteria bacterium 13_2_20CM_2_71_6]